MNTEEEAKELYDCEGDQEGLCDSFTDPDWRRKPRRSNILPNTSFRARFGKGGSGAHFALSRGVRAVRGDDLPAQGSVDWRNAKVAAKHLKFCPGDNCRVWLPLYHFGSNFNMEDGLDIYCISCNHHKREEKRGKRVKSPQVLTSHQFEPRVTASSSSSSSSSSGAASSSSSSSALSSSSKYGVVTEKVDKFVQFQEEQENSPGIQENRTREVEKRISMAAIEAKGRFKREIKVDPEEVCKRLFQRGKYTCDITNEPLTPKCFLSHHSITFEVRESKKHDGKKVIDVICSDCRLQVV